MFPEIKNYFFLHTLTFLVKIERLPVKTIKKMEQIENVIGQGNNFVREKKFAQAKEVYSEAIRLLSMVGDQSSEEVKQQYVRVFNNRAQACLSLVGFWILWLVDCC